MPTDQCCTSKLTLGVTGLLFGSRGRASASNQNSIEMTHDCLLGLVNQGKPNRDNSSVRFGLGFAPGQPVVLQPQRIVRSNRLEKANLVISKGRDDSMGIGKLVNQPLFQRKHEYAWSRNSPERSHAGRLIYMEWHRIPALGEFHHLVAVNREWWACDALAGVHVFKEEHRNLTDRRVISQSCNVCGDSGRV
jgi:hypothetical protein